MKFYYCCFFLCVIVYWVVVLINIFLMYMYFLLNVWIFYCEIVIWIGNMKFLFDVFVISIYMFGWCIVINGSYQFEIFLIGKVLYVLVFV